ncbi:hypothetical protein GQ457_18G019760 [Hibiscus cannabinus]
MEIEKKKTLGRKKVEMVKMTNESHLQVTFSKRRTGLFKKASELGIICGVDLAIVVHSPGKKVYSFGHPTVDTVVDRFLGCETPDPTGISQLLAARRDANIRELSVQASEVMSRSKDEKKRGDELNRMKKANQQQFWCQLPVQELGLSQLLQIKSAMEGLKKNVQAEQLVILNATTPQFHVGSSSTTEWTIPNFETNDNDMAFSANMLDLDGGYTVPDMIVPSPGYNLNPTQGYTANPFGEYAGTPAQALAEGYTVTPVQGYTAVTPAQGYTAVNPTEVYHVDPVQGYNINSGEGENANPGGSAAGGNNGIPQEKVFDPLEFLLEDLEAGFSG